MPGTNVTIHFHAGTVFSEFKLEGHNLLLAKSLDFEKIPSYEILIVGKDFENDMAICHVKVLVQNLNEHAPVFTRTAYAGVVPETAYIGHSVLRIDAKDPDSDCDCEIQYKIIDSRSNPWFKLNGQDVVVRTTRLQPGCHYKFQVEATDGTFVSKRSTVYIVVTGVFRPIFVNTTFIVNVPENLPIGDMVLWADAGTDNKTDVTYSIESSVARHMFHINETQGKSIQLFLSIHSVHIL